MINKKIQTLFITVLAFALLSSFVTAAGVAFPYTSDNPLSLKPGESKDVQFYLQNNAGDNESMTLRASVTNGTEIATITDYSKDYVVPYGVKNPGVPVTIRITPPTVCSKGDKYNVILSFTSVTQGAKGQFALGSAFDRSFDVVMADSCSTGNSSPTIYIIVAVIIIALIILFYRRRNKN